jgi:hypothetical protein
MSKDNQPRMRRGIIKGLKISQTKILTHLFLLTMSLFLVQGLFKNSKLGKAL